MLSCVIDNPAYTEALIKDDKHYKLYDMTGELIFLNLIKSTMKS